MSNLKGSPLPSRLKAARKEKGISQKQLGIMAGLDPSVASPRINQYEKATHAPDINMIRALAKVLDKPLPYFYSELDWIAELLSAVHNKDLELATEIINSNIRA